MPANTRAQTYTAPDAVAHGLHTLATRADGSVHRVAFIASRNEGRMWIVTDDLVERRPREVTVEEAREVYARYIARGAYKGKPCATFVGTDAYSRYVFSPEQVGER